MLLRELHHDFQQGLLSEAILEPAAGGSGWVICVLYHSGESHYLEARRTAKPRVFSKIETPARLIERVGFSKATVQVKRNA